MNLVVNGEPMALEPGATVADLVGLVARTDRGVAVAIDREVVPRSSWATTPLHEGDRVEVLTAAAGG